MFVEVVTGRGTMKRREVEVALYIVFGWHILAYNMDNFHYIYQKSLMTVTQTATKANGFAAYGMLVTVAMQKSGFATTSLPVLPDFSLWPPDCFCRMIYQTPPCHLCKWIFLSILFPVIFALIHIPDNQELATALSSASSPKGYVRRLKKSCRFVSVLATKILA